MTSIRSDFREAVETLEANRLPLKKISFKDADELTMCADYFFDRAAANPNQSAKFAEWALAMRGMFPENENWADGAFTLKKALINVGRQKSRELGNALNSSSNTPEHAKGTCKFFGELYNIGFINPGPLLSCAGHLEKSSHEIASECLKLIEQTVSEKVLSVQIDDLQAEHRSHFKSLVELIKRVQKDPKYQKPIAKPVPKATEFQFPSLNGETSGGKRKSPVTSQSPSFGGESSPTLSAKEQFSALKNLLKNLSSENVAEVKNKILQNPQHFINNNAIHLFYEHLVKTALGNPAMANEIVEICQIRLNENAWSGRKTEDAQTIIASATCKKIEQNGKHNIIKPVVFFLKALIDKNFCNIATLQSILDSLLLHMKQQDLLAEPFSALLSQPGAPDVKQLLPDTKTKILDIMGKAEKLTVGLYNKLSSNGDSNASRSNGNGVGPGTSNGNTINIQDFFRDVEHKQGEEQRQFIEYYTKQSGWDSNYAAETLLEVFLSNGDLTFNILLAVQINSKDPTFKSSLSNAVCNRLRLLINADQQGDNHRRCLMMANFLSELFKVDWVNRNQFFKFIQMSAMDVFKSAHKTAIFRALIEPSLAEIRAKLGDESFIFYLQQLRMRVSESFEKRTKESYLEIVQMVKIITGQENAKEEVFEQAHNSAHLDIAMTGNRVNAIQKIIATNENPYDCYKKITALKIDAVCDLQFLAHCLITQGIANPSKPLYTFLVEILANFEVRGTSGEIVTFKMCVARSCQQQLETLAGKGVTIDNFMAAQNLLELVGHLYKSNLFDRNFIKDFFSKLLQNEHRCERTAVLIGNFMSIVGSKFEEEHFNAVGYFFNYFENVMNTSGDNMRSQMYRKLIVLRENKWQETTSVGYAKPQTPVVFENFADVRQPVLIPHVPLLNIQPIAARQSPAIVENQGANQTLRIDFFDMENPEKLQQTVESLKYFLTTDDRVGDFLKYLITRPSVDYQEISACCKIIEHFTPLRESKSHFVECLSDVLNLQFEETSCQTFWDEPAKLRLTRLITMAGELYSNGLMSGEDFALWLLHKNIHEVPAGHLSQLSSNTSSKISTEDNKSLKMALKMLDATVHKALLDTFSFVQKDMEELFALFKIAGFN